ncbi:MAG: radical SAM protein [Armatimonadetes bacterium]|nr:radical SAM protein [Armatimonadota bacterium]
MSIYKNKKEERKKILQSEKSLIYPLKEAYFKVALIYPNNYYLGTSNLGFQTIYGIINQIKQTSCERVFLPEDWEFYLNHKITLKSLEYERPLNSFDIIAFSISYELDYLNFLKILRLANFPLMAKERENFPLILAGGIAPSINPLPISEFADLIVIGEGEEIIIELIEKMKAQKREKKEVILKTLNLIPGVYVPSLYNSLKKITKRMVKKLNFNTHSFIISPYTEFKNTFLIELTRGCIHTCNFCAAGNFLKPYRLRKFSLLKEAVILAKKYTHKIGLIGNTLIDYPEINDLLKLILKENMLVSFSSLRADKLNPEIFEALYKSGQNTLTLAPETANKELRFSLNKKIEDQDLYKALEFCAKFKIKNLRLYFMLGLPYEKEKHLDEILNLIKNLNLYQKKIIPDSCLNIKINQFIPKPFTPFEKYPQQDIKKYYQDINFLKENLKKEKGFKINFESPKTAFLEGIITRGDQQMGKILKEIYLDYNFRNLLKAFHKFNLNPSFYLQETKEILPWDFITL